jgi:hypothetical protein
LQFASVSEIQKEKVMAKILFKATGKVEHVDPNTAHLFVVSGAAEYVVEAPKPVEARWFLFKEELSDLPNSGTSVSLAFKCGGCKSTSHFYPNVNLGAKKIVEVVHPHCTHRVPCPLEIANDYVVAGGGTPLPTYENYDAAVNKAQAEALARPKAF